MNAPRREGPCKLRQGRLGQDVRDEIGQGRAEKQRSRGISLAARVGRGGPGGASAGFRSKIADAAQVRRAGNAPFRGEFLAYSALPPVFIPAVLVENQDDPRAPAFWKE